MTAVRFNPERPHQAFVDHWTKLNQRGELDRVPMARAYRKPLSAELTQLEQGHSTDQGTRARAILWNGYGARFIEHLGLRMGASPRHTKAADELKCATFSAERLHEPLNHDTFHSANPVLIEPGKIPDLISDDPAAPRVWELFIRGGARFYTDGSRITQIRDRDAHEAKTIHLNLLTDTLHIAQNRTGGAHLLFKDGKDLYLRITSPEVADKQDGQLGRPNKYRMAYFGNLVPWQVYGETSETGFWPGSLMTTEHDIPPFIRVHPWLFGWHDFGFHRNQHEAAAGVGQNMANTLVHAALSLIPEITDWDTTAEFLERLVQMDPNVSKPKNIQLFLLQLCANLRTEMTRHPETRERILTFLNWAKQFQSL